MEYRYELLDHTADMMVRAYGKTVEECFAAAGFALFDQTVDLSGIDTQETTHIEVAGDDPEDMLYSFLSELLFIEDCDNLILKEFDVRFDGNKVICDAKGEYLDRNRHRVRSEIKAVTYHMMNVDPAIPSVTVLFDT